jgi:hypothetical protein
MRSMARALKKGATFTSAHNKAMRSVGKWVDIQQQLPYLF